MEYLYTIYRNWRMKGASMTEYAIILGFVAMIAMYAFTYQINGCLLYTSPSPRDS